MVHVGLDLSRTQLDVHVIDEAAAALAVTTAVPDRDRLAVLAERIGGFGGPVYAPIESMNGAVFVHDQLEDVVSLGISLSRSGMFLTCTRGALTHASVDRH